MKRIITYILLLTPIMIFAQGKEEGEKEISFTDTKNYINKKVAAFSIPFDKNKTLKVDSLSISEDGLVKLVYNDTDVIPVTFYIANLFAAKFSNDEGGCNCGITLNNGFITFWIKKDEGIAVRVQENEAKSVYKAFVHLIKLTKDKELFAD